MNESRNFRIALFSGGSARWRNTITPLLLAQSDCFVEVESVDELLSISPDSRPEIIFVCHQAESDTNNSDEEQIRRYFMFTPKVFLAEEKTRAYEIALAIGACAILESSFSKDDFVQAFNQCCQIAQARRWEALKQQQMHCKSELFMQEPFCQLFVDASGMVTLHNNEAAKVVGFGTVSVIDFTELSLRFFVPRALTYPSELENAVKALSAWNGILTGCLPDSTERVYRVVCTPHVQSDSVAGVLLTLHDVSTVQREQANLWIELQAARDCMMLAAENGTAVDLLHLSNPDIQTSTKEDTFNLRTLMDSVKGNAELTIPDYLPEYFQGDAKSIEYIFQSILGGCSRFSESTPRISISIKTRDLTTTTLQFNICVRSTSVTSENFQNIENYLATIGQVPHASSGLGLAAVLLKKISGTMLIRTEYGTSRTVSINIPLRTDVNVSGSVSLNNIDLVMDEAPIPLPSLKVLVADDNLLEQTTLKHILEDIGCQTIVVSNGKEAVDEFENGEFNVVLMDILMPVMDGFEATRLIRERERITGGATPVIALTSYSLKAIQDKCNSVGMNGYLAKPVAKQKLLDLLRSFSKHGGSDGATGNIQTELDEFPMLDAHEVLGNIGYSLELYKEMVEMYLSTFSRNGSELAAKLMGDDLTSILESAHSLKGILSNIGAKRLAEIARRIQEMCDKSTKPDGTVWSPIVEAQTAVINEALKNINWNELTQFVADNNQSLGGKHVQ